MSSTFRRLGQSELLPRYIFAESLFVRRRVLEVGAVASTGGQSAHFLSQRGARQVLACDDDVAAVEEAQRQYGSPSLRFRASVFDDLEPHSFDLVIVADLAPYALAPLLMQELAQLVARSGHLLGGLRNPAGLSLSQLLDPEGHEATPTYGQLLDALSPYFPSIEVATQSPVLGYQLALETGEGLQVDGSLARTAEAAYFVVLAGQEPVKAFDPTWVQLPPEPLAYTGSRLDEYAQRNRSWEERSSRLKEALGKTRTDLADRDAQVTQLRLELEKTKEEVARLTVQLDTHHQRPGGERERDELTSRVRRAEAERDAAVERAQDAERRLQQHEANVEAFKGARRKAEEELLAAEDRARKDRARAEQFAITAQDLQGKLDGAYQEINEAREQLTQAQLDLSRSRTGSDRAAEQLRQQAAELEEARAREVALASRYSGDRTELDQTRAELSKATVEVQLKEEALERLRADVEALRETGGAEGRAALEAREELEQARARFEEALERKEQELLGARTEIESARSEAARIKLELTAYGEADRGAGKKVSTLTQQVEALQEELEIARARAGKLEKDGAARLAAERQAREQLEAQVAEAREKTEWMQGRKDALEQKVAQQAVLLEELSRQRETVSSSKTELEQQRADLEQQLAEAAARAEALEKKQEQTQNRATELSQELAKTFTGVAEQRKQIVALQEQVEAARRDADRDAEALVEQRSATERAAASGRQQVAEVQERFREAVARLEALALKVEDAEDARDQAQGQVAVLEDRLRELDEARAREAALSEERGEAAREVERLRGELDRTEREKGELVTARAEVEGERDALRGDLERAEREKEELLTARAQVEGERDALRDTVAQLRGEVETQSGAQTSLADQLRAAKAEAEERAGALERAEEARSSVDQELSAARAAKEALEQKVTALEAEASVLLELREKVASLEGERSGLTEEAARQRAELEQVDGERAALAQKAEDEGKERARLQGEVERAEEERKHLAQLKEMADQERVALKEELEKAQASLEKARGDLDTAAAQLASTGAEVEKVKEDLHRVEEDRERAVEARDQVVMELNRQLEDVKTKLSAGERAAEEAEALRERAETAEEKERKASAGLGDRDKKLELLERRLKAQDAELNALRKAAGRPASGQVQQIYERAAAEISAVKAELFKGPPGTGGAAPTPTITPQKPAAPRQGEGKVETKVGARPAEVTVKTEAPARRPAPLGTQSRPVNTTPYGKAVPPKTSARSGDKPSTDEPSKPQQDGEPEEIEVEDS